MRESHDFGKRSESNASLPKIDFETTFGCVGSEKNRSEQIMNTFFSDRNDMCEDIAEAEKQIKENLKR